MNLPKKIKIICEEAYAETIWSKQLLGGLTKELKKRRAAFEQLTHGNEIETGDSVCIVGLSNAWTEKTIKKCNAKRCVPVVLSSQSGRFAEGTYHLVCPDVCGMIKNLSRVLEKAGRKNLALYGANNKADLDRDRTELFLTLVPDSGNVYRNTGNLENCFRSFLPKAGRYDAVLCVNGYAAISLVKKLEKESPEILEDLVILSFEEVLRHSKYNQWISLIDLNLEAYGGSAAAVLEMAGQREDISTFTVTMKVDLCEIPKKNGAVHFEMPEENEELFEDPEIISMAKIEQLLRDADDMDHHIIAMLLSNAKYSEIADSCYMTEGNVKYRVKKYMNICNCSTKKELLELLQEYLQ